MRYALDWCLYGFPKRGAKVASDQCSTACGRISKALEINLLNVTASSTYDYCQDPDFLPNVGSCASCYMDVPNQLYMSNCECFALREQRLCLLISCTQFSTPSSLHARINLHQCYHSRSNPLTSSPTNLHRTSPISVP